MKNQNIKYKFLILSLAIAGLIWYTPAIAALLYTGSGQQVVYESQSFVMNWFLDTQDEEINTIQLKLKYNPSLLEVVETSTGGSSLNLWIQTPVVNSRLGEINLIGGVSGGIRTNKVMIFSSTVRPKTTGTAKISMHESSAVLLADGQGSQAPLLFSQISFNINPADAIPAQIKSNTHPDPDKWYQDRRAVISFSPLPGEVYSYSFSSNLEIFPDDNVDEIRDEYVYEKMPDGIYYFRLNSKTGSANWQEAGVFRVQIDATPPEKFEPATASDPSVFNGQPFVSFATADKVSGVSFYEVKFGYLGHWEKVDGTFLKIPGLVLGDRIEVRAVDAAGNQQSSVISYEKSNRPWFKNLLLWFIIVLVVALAYAGFRAYRHLSNKYRS